MSTIEELQKAALEYHRKAPAGKIKVTPTKPVVTQRELSLAYSPGVAAACEEIVRDPREVATLTDRKSTRLNSSHLRRSRMPSSA